MAQRTEKEETEYKAVPDTITLCLNNCGLTGNPATSNLCHNCFNATTASSSSPTAVATATPPHKFSAVAGAGGRSSRSTSSRSPVRTSDPAETRRKEESSEAAVPAKREVNRCSGCRRKVGLTGFRCRCGDLFCADHRYSDRHDCGYDYKSAGREAIASENPVVKAAKIIRV